MTEINWGAGENTVAFDMQNQTGLHYIYMHETKVDILNRKLRGTDIEIGWSWNLKDVCTCYTIANIKLYLQQSTSSNNF